MAEEWAKEKVAKEYSPDSSMPLSYDKRYNIDNIKKLK